MLTGFARGSLPAIHGPQSWVRGAVHDREGVLVPASQRFWAGDPAAPVAADPEWVRIPRLGRHVEGTWLYAGHWPRHFGHFLLETLTNLWPDPARTTVDGLMAHRRFRGEIPLPGRKPRTARVGLPTWKRELIELAGYGGLPVLQVDTAPAHVETVLVPTRPVVLKAWAQQSAVDVWQRIAARVEPGPDPLVYLSRSVFHDDLRHEEKRVRMSREWERELDESFADRGFRVVHPQTMPIPEQVAIVRGARVLAGSTGSALHLAAFAGPGTRVLEIGDRRTPDAPAPAQQMIDAACGNLTAFCAYRDATRLGRLITSATRESG